MSVSGPLTGQLYYDYFTNTWRGQQGDETTERGVAIEVVKPIHLTFLGDDNFQEALLVDGEVGISQNTTIGQDLVVGNDLYVGGKIVAIGDVTGKCYLSFSDKRLKEDIKEIKDTDLSRVKVYSYKLKGNRKMFYGVMAQDLLEDPKLSRMVSITEGQYLTVDYNQFTPLLIKETQQLRNHQKLLMALVIGSWMFNFVFIFFRMC